MRSLNLLSFLFAVVMLSDLAQAQDSLVLAPGFTATSVGVPVSVDVEADFASTVIGGEIRVDYDPTVLFLSAINWDPSYGDDPELRCPPGGVLPGGRGCAGDHAFIAMGQLSGLGSGRVAELVFDAVAVGISTVELTPVSPFAGPTGGTVSTALGTATVQVPEPAVVMGLAIGVAALALRARPRSRKA